MTEELVKNLFDRLPGWFFTFAGVLFLAGFAVSIWWMALGAKRLAHSMGREDRVYQLTQELHKEKESSRTRGELASQLVTVVANVRAHLYSLNQLRQGMAEQEVSDLIQRIVEAVAADIKHRSGERHRCGLWVEEDGELILTFASSGFPEHYLHRGRKLEINRSVAGRAYRLGKTISRPDVKKDEDWEPNRESNSPYTSLIAIPLKDGSRKPFGVLTIDALGPMNDEDELIGELYAAVIEGAYFELLISLEQETLDGNAEPEE